MNLSLLHVETRASCPLITEQLVREEVKGSRRKYGEKLTLETLTDAHLKSEAVEKGIRTCVYQVQAWHKNFP